MVPTLESDEANLLFIQKSVAEEISVETATDVNSTTLHQLLDHVAAGVPEFEADDLSAAAAVRLADHYVGAVLKLSAGLTFVYLRDMLCQIERELAARFARPDLAPLHLENMLTLSEYSLLATAYEQHAPLTIQRLRSIIDRVERQIFAVPQSASPVRTIVEMMESVARDMAKENAVRRHER